MSGAAATSKNLRVFGLAFVVLFALLAIFGKWVWKWESPGWVTAFVVLSGLFLIPSLFVPMVRRPLYGPWMKMAHFLGVIMTTVLMSVLYGNNPGTAFELYHVGTNVLHLKTNFELLVNPQSLLLILSNFGFA